MKVINSLLLGMTLTSCSNQPHMNPGLIYPDMISPIYYLDTFQIPNPLVAIIDSVPYIIPESFFKDSLNKHQFLKKKGIIRYLTQDLTTNKVWDYTVIYSRAKKTGDKSFYALQRNNEFLYIEDNLKFIDSIQGMAIYHFDIKPQSFLLTLITKKDSILTGPVIKGELANDYILGIEYSTDYMLATLPVFEKKDRKTLNKLIYRRLHGKDPDWTYYLPNWIYNRLF